MRSRYSAFVKGAVDYLIETHDPDTRGRVSKASLTQYAKDTMWLGLEIVATDRGGEDDDEGIVEFIARGALGGKPFAQRERSRFRKLDGRWVYIDGVTRAR
jgi:SEC-C motif-containing protein